MLTASAAGIAGCTGDSDAPAQTNESEPSPPGSDDSDGQTGCDVENPHPDYDQTEVAVRSDGAELGSVTAAIADTEGLRYTGLSDTACLPEDRGMLFVLETADTHPFVMREMDFGLDIVYADVDGTITDIFHAPAPGPNEDGNEQRYPGFGKYVLEVNYGWTTDRGIETGDDLVFEL
ncbi:DUF192 domain-containing protein [Halovenus carboxidivorans]|uniref:DUF192 domain-containing protein n=1 Tax=Halovenus carboxidivorans TaxID=2692199 RepID=UPI0034A14BAA